MKPQICVDLDGVLARHDEWRGVDHFGELIPGSREFLERLSQKYEIIIYTCRCNENAMGIEKSHLLVNRVRDWLESHGLPYDEIYAGQGKPVAAFYIDDRGIQCDPQQNPYAFRNALNYLNLDQS